MNTLKYFRGAIVEVLEDNGTSSVIKIKGGARCRVNNGQLLDTDENKTRLPEWITVGACAYLDGDILTITRVGNTQYEATGIKYSTHQGAINYLLHHGRAVVECDTDREPIQRPADYDKLTNITVDELHIDTDNIFELMTTANEAGADNLAAYAHGLMCSGDQPDTDTITNLIEGLLWTLQEDVEENEAEADEVREKIEKTKAEGYEVYIDSCDDTSDPATIQNAKKLFNEDIADNLSYLDDLYNNYIYPALSRLRAFVAAFSTDGATTDDPAQCTIDFESVAAPAPVVEVPAPAEPLPGWCKDNTKVLNTLYNSIGTIKDFTYNKVLECWQCTFVNTATGTEYKKHSISYMKPIEEAPAAEPVPAADAEAVEAWQNEQAAATVTDAEVLETAARIRANYEAMQADIEAEREQAAAAFAEAITAYCEDLSRPEPLAWEPETIIIPFEPRPAAEVEQPRRRHRLNLRPRLSRWLHPVRWVAVVFVVCLLSGLLLGMNTSTAAADDIAAVYELHPVTVTAEAPDTFIEDKAPCLIEDKAPAPSPVKKLAAPSTVKNMADAAECSSQKTDTADTPAGQKTDADGLPDTLQPDSQPHGLTICEGTAWAYTMMNWA